MLTHPNCQCEDVACIMFCNEGLDFGDGVGLLLQKLIVVFVVDTQVQPQVVQSLTNGQSLLTPVRETVTETRCFILCHENNVTVTDCIFICFFMPRL